MANKVVDNNEVFLNGVYYPLKGPVRSMLASIYPGKVVTGDTTRDSQPRASVLAISDLRGGIGIEKMEGPGDVTRAWWTTFQIRGQGHMLLPRLATETGDQSVSGVYEINAIGDLSDEIYVAFSTTVKKYNAVTDGWGSSLHTLPSVATDVITVRLNGTVHMVFACETNYVHTADGATFNDETDDVKYLAFWDDRLWGIDTVGRLKWCNDLSPATPTWTDDAQLPLPDGYATAMFVARDATGNPIIYAATKVGLYAHDALNNRFVETGLTLPFHERGGLGSTVWRDGAYITAGLGVYKFVNGPTAVVSLVGPDRDHGIPQDKRGFCRRLLPSHNELLALIDGTATVPLNLHTGGSKLAKSPFAPDVVPGNIGTSSILGWDGRGWEVKWVGDAASKAITSAVVSNAYSKYRLWWAYKQRIYYMELPSDIINPKQTTDTPYATSGELLSPWFDAFQADVDKLALSLRVEVDDASSTETVVVDYATNFSETWTSLGTISSDGTTEYVFPDSTTPTGTTFRSIRFRATLARGTASQTVSPDILSITLVYRKKLPAKWGFRCNLDIAEDYKGNTPMDMRAALVSAIESVTKVEFTFRDDAGGDRNYYVDVVSATGLEYTGYDEKGESLLEVVEP